MCTRRILAKTNSHLYSHAGASDETCPAVTAPVTGHSRAQGARPPSIHTAPSQLWGPLQSVGCVSPVSAHTLKRIPHKCILDAFLSSMVKLFTGRPPSRRGISLSHPYPPRAPWSLWSAVLLLARLLRSFGFRHHYEMMGP